MTDDTFKVFWGIDGCKGGWVCMGLNQYDTRYAMDVFGSLDEFWVEYGADALTVLIDMPIGIPAANERNVEAAARDVLGKRRNSVFAVPVRTALEYGADHGFASQHYASACDINRQVTGKAFSRQSWAIMPRIHEIDTLLRTNESAREKFHEAHPEVLFWALAKKRSMKYGKKLGLGFHERLQVLEKYQPNAIHLIQQMYDRSEAVLSDDDIVDALVCAICARMGNFATLSESPPHDEHGLPMQMVYPQI